MALIKKKLTKAEAAKALAVATRSPEHQALLDYLKDLEDVTAECNQCHEVTEVKFCHTVFMCETCYEASK